MRRRQRPAPGRVCSAQSARCRSITAAAGFQLDLVNVLGGWWRACRAGAAKRRPRSLRTVGPTSRSTVARWGGREPSQVHRGRSCQAPGRRAAPSPQCRVGASGVPVTLWRQRRRLGAERFLFKRNKIARQLVVLAREAPRSEDHLKGGEKRSRAGSVRQPSLLGKEGCERSRADDGCRYRPPIANTVEEPLAVHVIAHRPPGGEKQITMLPAELFVSHHRRAVVAALRCP